ncbi:hypothetical protein [Pendulispora albinea]|uniref:Outer membrane protein beta-barrel domain-containing protein n=1 Tax=Pendulispora albinea TaxID=2741071 RepID=A0ABZ2MBY9_9BACT
MRTNAHALLGARAVASMMAAASLLLASSPASARGRAEQGEVQEGGAERVEKKEDRAEQRDASTKGEPQPKREIVWMKAEAGFESLHLRTFKADIDTVSLGILPANAVGPTVGVGVGVRFVFVTLGVRGRFSSFGGDAPGQREGFQLWTLNAELGLRAPVGRFEPYVTLAGGYATFGGLSTAFDGLRRGLDVNGVNTRLAIGVDYYLTQNISVGASLGGELLFITRHGTSVRDLATPREVDTLNQAKARVLEANGSNVGAAWSGTAGLGVHF